MSNSQYYRPLIIDSLIPDIFPPVALFMRSGNGNHILYKPAEVPFSKRDSERLINNGTKHIYVRSGDYGDVNRYLEDNLSHFLADEQLPLSAKNTILQQISIEYVAQAIRSPEGVTGDIKRCKSLVRHLFNEITSADALMGLLTGLTASSYFMAHSVQVAVLSMLMHQRLFKIERDELVEVGVGGMFHDIGLTFLAGDIDENPDALSELDWRKAQLHPTMGHEFLAKMADVGPVALEIVKHHHERWDGSGYPDRLKGNDISRSAQIAAACDIYSTLTNERAYRKASTSEEALKLLKSECGSYFSTEIYQALAAIVCGE